jgi:opacity protein-like surface antigen
MKKLIFASLFMLLISCTAVAGDTPKVEVFGGYSIQRLGMPEVSSGFFPVLGFGDISDSGLSIFAESTKYQKYGFNASFTYNTSPVLGLEADFKYNTGDILNMKIQIPIYLDEPSAYYSDSILASEKHQDFAFLAGPRFSYRKNKTVTPFAHALMGFDQAKVTYKVSYFGDSMNMDAPNDTGFAAVVGGGVDLNVQKNFAVRLIQADYFLTKHNNNLTNQTNETWNNMSLSFGVVLRFGGIK